MNKPSTDRANALSGRSARGSDVLPPRQHNKVLLSLLSLVLFLLLFLALYLPTRPSGQVLDEGWTAEYRGTRIPNIHFPYIQSSSPAADPLTFTTTLTDVQGDALIFRPGGYAFTVDLNGQQIAGIGDLAQPTANVWNTVQLIPLTNLRPGANTLQIRLSAANRSVGLGAAPTIGDYKSALATISFLNWFNNDFLLLNQGAGFIVGILLIAIARSRRSLQGVEFFMGVAAILASLYVFDFNMRASTGSLAMLLVVRKITMSSGYLGALLFVCGLELYFRGHLRFGRVIAVPALLAVLILALQPDQFAFSTVLIYTNIVLLITLVVACVMIFRNSQNRDRMIVPAILLTLSIVESILVMVFALPWPFTTQFVVLFSVVYFGTDLLLDYQLIYQENLALRAKANKDPLTGVYNRNVLKDALVWQFGALALIDINNFKYFNDTYGHAEGDRLLLLVVDTIRKSIRQDDLIVRIGGDEFVLLLKHILPLQADETLERLSVQFARVAPDERVGLSYGVVMITDSLEATITHADQRMYEMKAARKQAGGH